MCASPQPYHGIELVTLGTAAGPPPQPGRAGIASALSVHGRTYLVDCGRSAVTQYLRSGLTFESLASIFVTHLHADHVCDYYNFFLLGGFGRSNVGDGILSPASVFGPGPAGALPPPFGGEPVGTINPDNPTPGLADLTGKCIEAFAYSSNVFMRDSGMPDVRDLVDVNEIAIPDVGASPHGPTAPRMDPFPVMEDDRVRVSAILVPHGPVFPSFAFRFDTDNGSVVFSGDTAKTPNIITLAGGADVLVHEALDLGWYEQQGRSPAFLDHLEESHVAATEVGKIAQEAEVRTLVLSHLGPAATGTVTDGHWQSMAEQDFTGRVIVADDLQRVRVS